MPISTRLSVITENYRMSLIRINVSASDAALFELGQAINSLQEENVEEIIVTERRLLI